MPFICLALRLTDPWQSGHWQVYAQCLQLAFQRCGARESSADEDAPMQEFHELCQRVAAAHAGFVSNAGETLAGITHNGIDYVFEVGMPAK